MGRADKLSLSVAEQLVDAGLGAGSFIDLLDDDRAGERRAAVLARQGSGHDYGVRRNAAVTDLSGRAVDDLGRGAEEHAHRQDRASLDDHALGHLRAGADKAIVLDDDGTGLERLE